jgi:hypothetical protein
MRLMRHSQADAFIDEILADRAPQSFRADPDQADVLRVAIALRASRPGADRADDQFVDDLHRRLATSAERRASNSNGNGNGNGNGHVSRMVPRQAQRSQPIRVRRRAGALLGAAAAALALVVGTIAGTRAVTGRAPAPALQHAAAVRSGVLLTADGHSLGKMYVYKGQPSWVFLNVHDSTFAGTYTCEFQFVNGTTVPVGTLELHDGSGVFVRIVRVDMEQVRAARLVTSTGSTLATATFS